MTLVTTALDRVARQCGVQTPSSWINATRTDHVEIRDDFLLETISDILDRVDVASPIAKQTTITGDGSENYSLPADFLRLAGDQLAVYDNALDRPVMPVASDGQWTYIKDIGTTGVQRYYRVKGYDGNFTIDLYDEPSAAVTITVSYIADIWMASSGGAVGNTLTDETDVLLLPRRTVESGCVWRFRERRGLPYADKYNEYEAQIARLSNDTRGRRVVNMGGTTTDVRWQDLVPSFIPAS